MENKKWMPVSMRRRVKKILRKNMKKVSMVDLTDTELLELYDKHKKNIRNKSLQNLILRVDQEIIEQYMLTDNAES